MAVDTRNKRASAILFALPFGRVFPAPDGTIATADRKHIGFSYPGIAAGAPAEESSEGIPFSPTFSPVQSITGLLIR